MSVRIINKAIGNAKLAAVRLYLNGLARLSEKRAGNQTVRLFGSPRKGLLTATDTAYLDAARWEKLSLNGHAIQTYHWQGSGKRVLLAHGWESNSARWKPLIALLRAANFDIVAMDAPRHGATGGRFFGAILYGEMMNEVVEKFKPAVIIGHSIGGFATTYFMDRFEKKKTDPSVSTLILLATPSNLRHIFEIFLNTVGLNHRVKRGYYAEFTRIAGASTEELTAENFCQSLNVKSLIIHDRTDDVAPFSDSAKIEKALVGSRRVITEGYGHRLQEGFVYKTIVDFLATN
jgi:pimeloyl-ACP methyl ester carboxylesterase